MVNEYMNDANKVDTVRFQGTLISKPLHEQAEISKFIIFNRHLKSNDKKHTGNNPHLQQHNN